MKRLLILMVFILIMSGCGQKGDLVLPDSPSDDASTNEEREGR